MQIIENKALLLKVREPVRITTVIPKSKQISEHEVLVRWGLEEAQVLKNLRLKNVPSPIEAHYDWPGLHRPFVHQKTTSAFLTLHRRAFCFNEQGTGKTSSVIWASDYLMNIKAIRRVLVLCPLSIMESAWGADLFKFAMHRTVAIAHSYSKEKRIEAVQSEAEYVIVNYDGLEIIADAVKQEAFDLIVIDEANSYKNVATRRWKVLNSIIKPDTWVWMMTGTPASQSPTDAYGLAKIINPTGVPKFFGAFRDQVMTKITQFKWIPKKSAERVVHEALQPAIRFTKEECLDLPEMTYTTRHVPLSSQQQKFYDVLRRNMMATAAGEEITTVNAAANLNKLLQLSCLVYDTPVLTKGGWVPICEITSKDILWDGQEWVSCGGAIFKGVRSTIVLDGVEMTPDHLVLTVSGWKTAQECVNGDASFKFKRQNVWIPDRFRKSRYIKRKNQKSYMAMPLHLRDQSNPRVSESAIKASTKRKTLRVPSRGVQHNSRYVVYTRVSRMAGYAETVFRYFRQRFQKLRRAWDNSMQTLEKFFREFLVGYESNLYSQPNFRSYRRKQRVQQEKLPLGDCKRAIKQHTIQPDFEYTERKDDAHAGSGSLRFKESNTACPSGPIQLDDTKSFVNSGKTKVFDILNCGPRNRFVVQGKDGQHLIVHNCGAVYADTGEVIAFDAKSRMAALLEVIEEASHKVIVFAPFRHAIEIIAEELRNNKITCDVIHGGVSATKRTEIFAAFQSTDTPHVLVIQPQAAAHGVTLHAANVVVWWGPITSTETYLQANARVHRAGQRNPCTVVHIQGSPVEDRIYKMLSQNIDIHTRLIDLYKNEVEGT